MLPEGFDGGFGGAFVDGEDGQFGEAIAVLLVEGADADIHCPPDVLVLFFRWVVGGEVFEVVFAKGFEQVGPGDTIGDHTAAEGEGEGQAAALVDDLLGLGREVVGFRFGGRGQEGFGFGQGGELDLVVVLASGEGG